MNSWLSFHDFVRITTKIIYETKQIEAGSHSQIPFPQNPLLLWNGIEDDFIFI